MTKADSELPVIYEITGHGENALSGGFSEAVEKANMTVSQLTLLTEDAVPDVAAAIILNGPTSDFSEDDAAKVKDYLQGGGRALIACNFEYQDLPNFASVPLSNAVVLKDYRHLLMYLVQPWPQPSLHLAGIPMTEGAVEHFSDVRHLIITALAITGLALFGAYGIIQYEKKTWQLWKLSGPLKNLLALLIVVGMMIIVDFDDFFIKFHYLAFSNMNWVFSPTSNPIINLFPDDFFAMLFGIWWLFTILLLSLIQWRINRYLSRLI